MESILDYLHRVIQNNSWWVVAVELVLIGLVVYWIVDFLEGTRGERLFRGVIFILVIGVLVLNLIVDRLPMVRVQYLYKGFLIGVLIVAVAAFQPEIRRVLIRIGQPRLRQGSSQYITKTIETIISVATDLSATRTGAIVVIEGQVALGEFIETGAQLDALVSVDILKTIFYPGTSLHDMAVVVRGNRIVAARVQLPLAEAESIVGLAYGGELGSRHRAALGISLDSDALCVVVSEESGEISVAMDGKLNRNITETQLRLYLTGMMSQFNTGNRWPAIKRLFGQST